jgi:predicted RNase H-like HicB family nuclease
MKPKLHFEMKLPVNIFKEGSVYVSCCPIFDVYSQGDTEEEAKNNLVEALTGFILTCFEMGTLSEVLRNSGFTPAEEIEIEELDDNDLNFIDIPLPFMYRKNGPIECLA